MRKKIEFYDKLYIGEGIGHNADKIKWKLRHFAGLLNIYILALSDWPDASIEIINAAYLKQKYYKQHPPYIIGIAKGREEANQLVLQIVNEAYTLTGEVKIKEYLNIQKG